jgi:hypothetical protein
MIQKVIRVRRGSLSFEILRRGDQAGAPGTQRARYQLGIAKRAPANYDVKSFIDYIDQSISKIKIEFNLGMLLHKG